MPRLAITASHAPRPSGDTRRRRHHERRVRILRRTLNTKIKDALSACFDDPDGIDCTIAWMEVDELSSALYNTMQQGKTIQDILCDDDPGHRECREYDM